MTPSAGHLTLPKRHLRLLLGVAIPPSDLDRLLSAGWEGKDRPRFLVLRNLTIVSPFEHASKAWPR